MVYRLKRVHHSAKSFDLFLATFLAQNVLETTLSIDVNLFLIARNNLADKSVYL